jgi:hypothetical protein
MVADFQIGDILRRTAWPAHTVDKHTQSPLCLYARIFGKARKRSIYEQEVYCLGKLRRMHLNLARTALSCLTLVRRRRAMEQHEHVQYSP